MWGRALVAFFVLVFFPVSGWYGVVKAQSSGSTTANVIGTVKDSSGAAIPGATVIARQLETNIERTTQALEDGSHSLVQLPPRTYEIMVQAEGFSSKVLKPSLTIGTTSVAEFSLTVGIAYPSPGTWAATPFPASIGLYQPNQGYPNFDEKKARIYFEKVNKAIADLIKDMVKLWDAAGV